MAVSFVADWTLGLLPIWLLWNVQISRRRKGGIGVLLGFGLLYVPLSSSSHPFHSSSEETLDLDANKVGTGVESQL